MAVREYIGARYVPIFDGQWNNMKAYEPLTVVQYQGNSYTSRQFVPIGVTITDSNYWVETGNYNSQIEAYRQEVTQFDDRITANSDAIAAFNEELGTFEETITADNWVTTNRIADGAVTSDKISLQKMFVGMMNGANQSLTVVKDAKNNFVCVDAASAEDLVNINTYLSNMGVNANTNPLKAVILTHMHADHIGGFSEVAKFCNSETDIFIQMEPTANNDEYSIYIASLQNIRNICSAYNLKAPAVPANLQTYKWGDIEATIFNTNTAYVVDYDASWGQDSDDPNVRVSTLNNYSIVTLFNVYGNTYLDTGDIEGEAQIKLHNYMNPVCIAKNPHHFFNRMGYENFYDRLQPQIWLVSDNFKAISGILEVGRFDACYLYRYLVYNQNDTNILTNDNTNVEIEMQNANIIKASGYYVDKDYHKSFVNENTPDPTVSQLAFDAIIPPSIYYDNPYTVLLLGVDDLWKMKLWARGCPNFTFYLTTTMRTTHVMRQELDEIFTPSNINANIYLTFFDLPTAHVYSNDRYGMNISFNYDFKKATSPANLERWSHDCYPYKIEGTFNHNDSIANEPNWTHIRGKAKAISVTLESGRFVVLNNARNDGVSGTSSAYGYFEGTALATGGAVLYSVIINSSGIITSEAVNLSTNEITHPTISNITALF